LIEAALMGRRAGGCDINPLSQVLVKPRLCPPLIKDIHAALESGRWASKAASYDEDLLAFFHPATLSEMLALREWFLEKADDPLAGWIRMVATNRLTGHSPGFFSVRTMPPNQAVSAQKQRQLNETHGLQPAYHPVVPRILKKTLQLMGDLTTEESVRLRDLASGHLVLTASADRLEAVQDASVALVVTSPPFLDVVDYAPDNWLRCWFNGIDPAAVPMWNIKKLPAWEMAMEGVFRELHRVLKPGGWVAFEVGEVRKGKVLLEHSVARAASRAGLSPVAVLLHQQSFTKTSHCWGVENSKAGTNSHRLVLLRKAG
jgi:hypothetical protein